MSISARLNEDMGLLNDFMTEPTHESSPFISKQTVVVMDNNPNASYQSGQVVFQTDSLSSNGLYCDLKNGTIEIPMVFVVESLTADNGCDFTANAAGNVLGQKGLDALLSTKCSDLAFINTMSVELDGGSVVSVVDNISSYLIWRKHDSQVPYSRDELTNYVRDGVNWSIAEDGSLRNCSSRREVDTLTQPSAGGANEGMYHRSHNAFTSATNASVAAVFDDLYITQSNTNKVVTSAKYKIYHYTAHLKLSDLPFFASMPLARSLNVKITLNINQCAFTFTKDGDTLSFASNSMVISGSGRVNPLMIAASSETIMVPADDAQIAASASYRLRNGDYRVSASIVGNKFTGHVLDDCRNATHQHLRNCRLLVDCYQMLPSFESTYLSTVGQRSVNYLRVVSGVVENLKAGHHFDQLLNSGLVNMTKLILVIQHASISNGAEGSTHSPNISPFSSSPATTSPYMLDSFQVRVSGQGIYRDFLNYSYDEYIASIGRDGALFSPFSRKEWESGMYRYIVVPLTRKTPDQVNISQSISISGVNRCKKALDVFWFVEQETSLTLDVYSGKVIRA
jgi:hypothetical protein